MIRPTSSALAALRAISTKVDATAHNVANVETEGYKKTRVTIEENQAGEPAARAEKINTPGPLVQKQATDGSIEMVEMSNVELTEEIPNLALSRRFYQANLKTVQTEDQMLGSLMDIIS